MEIDEIISENHNRIRRINLKFDPISGEGSVGERKCVNISGFRFSKHWLPVEMFNIPLIRNLVNAGSVEKFIESIGGIPEEESIVSVINTYVRLRCRYDFPFWAATFIRIQSKEPGQGEIPFVLTRPQRRFVEKLEEMRKGNRPIRLVLLKARQWGGSTTSQIYMAWLQLVHKVGLNSVIISQTKKTSFAIKAMYDRALNSYPLEMLYKSGESFNPNEPKMVNVGQSGDYKKVPQRDCTLTIASYEAPDALRGDAYALVHCSEVGLWNPTDQKSPNSVVRSACSGILLRPYTMIIYESTANGSGNFFQIEYDAAKRGDSQFDALFISWFDIDLYSIPLDDDEERQFAEWLWKNRNKTSVSTTREESGAYLWWLWQKGATLQAIRWYVAERRGKESHDVMASEYPSDDVEAFTHSGEAVFDDYRIKALEPGCKPAKYTGEIYALYDQGPESLKDVRFKEDETGNLKIWALPEIDPDERILNRYLVVVDIGGRSNKADYSVIAVFDRVFITEGGKPEIVAQWYGHIDMDLLAWKAGQIASFYDQALLVIESNTIETRDRERHIEGGDQSQFLLNQLGGVYPNLYARSSPEDSIREGVPVKYGFHTNIQTKPMIISTLVKVIREGAYIERDIRCLNEYRKYERKQNGAYGAIAGEHDDILMTRAIGLHISFFDMEMPKIIPRNNPRPRKRKSISTATI